MINEYETKSLRLRTIFYDPVLSFFNLLPFSSDLVLSVFLLVAFLYFYQRFISRIYISSIHVPGYAYITITIPLRYSLVTQSTRYIPTPNPTRVQ